ncbi:MAG: hypothetical protein R6U50_13120 [Desulfobacterales bacterium]
MHSSEYSKTNGSRCNNVDMEMVRISHPGMVWMFQTNFLIPQKKRPAHAYPDVHMRKFLFLLKWDKRLRGKHKRNLIIKTGIVEISNITRSEQAIKTGFKTFNQVQDQGGRKDSSTGMQDVF